MLLKLKVNKGLMVKAAANHDEQKCQPNSVSTSVTIKCDANGSENPNANALFALLVLYLVGDSVPIRIPISFT